jgi:hypothetical protein
MKTPKGHLTYCTNIHAGESWPAHFEALQQHFPSIRDAIASNNKMGIGLRLSNEASILLSEEENLRAFREWLDKVNAYVFTMNGFPYGGFHHTVVKEHVHSPDWTTEERVSYTIRLFDILKQLLPDGMDGGISTSPLTYRHWFKHQSERSAAAKKATANIVRVIEHLIEIRNNSGMILHLDIEPEPDGLLETGDEFINWFEQELSSIAIPELVAAFNLSKEQAAEYLRDHLRLCYDVCHFAVGYESHSAAVKKLRQHKIQIGKFQISAALKARLDPDLGRREDIRKAFAAFNESTYLHQVVAMQQDETIIRYPDLPQALDDVQRNETTEWRAHFHVPVFIENYGLLQSTQNDILEILQIHGSEQLTNHLEVETYTWEVLPENLKAPLHESIIRELQWVKDNL